MTINQEEKARKFRALHGGPQAFIIPNPWDAGTARILAAMGFPALATTSAGLAFSLGRRDGEGLVTREEVLSHIRAVVGACYSAMDSSVLRPRWPVALPVSPKRANAANRP